jgi:preprotein translocase subunit SecB
MAENEQAVQQQFGVQRLYIKDLSFEAPQGVAVFGNQWQPQVNVDLNSKTQKVSDESFEVVLTVTITAKNNDETAFLVEVQQAGLFHIVGIEGEALSRALGVVAPNLLFPYLREAIDNVVIKGGFPAVGLQPVNFEALYLQSKQKSEEEASTH